MNIFTINYRKSLETLSLLQGIALFMLAFMFFGVPSISLAQWNGNPKINNLICNATGDQVNVASVTDGSGGAITVWQDKRNGNYDLYAQRIGSGGSVQWASNGVPVCVADSDQVNPAIVSDGSGGAIIAWQDKRSGAYDIYAQRINSSGVRQWNPASGDSVCKAAFDQSNIAMMSDGNGGALVTWEDFRSNAGPGLADIYSQKLNGGGVPQWIPNGVGVCTQAAAQHGPRITNDGAGGAFITWSDHRAGNYDIYAQRVLTGGGLVGTADGVAVCTSATDQTNPDICSNGAGGAIIVWQDFRSTTSIDIWVQSMSKAVAVQWPVNGIVMNNNVAYDQILPKIVSDGYGGGLMTWADFRGGTTSDIFAQRVDSTGVVATGWNVNGIAVSVSAANQSKPQIVSDSSHGAIITWMDKRDSATNRNTYDVFASRITVAGGLPWNPNGVPVCTADSTQTEPVAVCDGVGGAIITWQDKRGASFDVYASHVFRSGTTPVENSANVAGQFALEQNYPNPFNPSTQIRYTLPSSARVSLKVYNLLGVEVATLIDAWQDAGVHSATLAITGGGTSLSSGVYFYSLKAGEYSAVKKLTLIK